MVWLNVVFSTQRNIIGITNKCPFLSLLSTFPKTKNLSNNYILVTKDVGY